jgi:tRNA pseudouridine55 synthase
MSSFCGFLLINKPAGPTSHDIIDQLRRLTGVAKIGHAGTLDPFASGLLLCAVGREATRQLNKFSCLSKEYEAVFYLGAVSDTYDKTGKISEQTIAAAPSAAMIKKVLSQFVGKGQQVPPMFSAKKIGGKKLYRLARAGQIIARPPAMIEIYDLVLLDYAWPRLHLTINCSSGTYIRSLAFDLGERLGSGAYVEELLRTAIGSYNLTQAVNLEQLTKTSWQQYLR